MTDEFSKQFKFNRKKRLFVGTERECFLLEGGKIAPIAPIVLSGLEGNKAYGYELSACQLEIRTKPTPIQTVAEAIMDADSMLKRDEERFGFKTLHDEVAPYDMPLDVYPDPSGRYQRITENMPVHILRAACRVAGTHVHIGMASPDETIQAYNAAIEHLPKLLAMGDRSKGERLGIYKVMAPNFQPPQYESWRHYEDYAHANGFWKNPRNCWHFIRISVHGTIEFRPFGATPDPLDIVRWAEYCHSICKEAL